VRSQELRRNDRRRKEQFVFLDFVVSLNHSLFSKERRGADEVSLLGLLGL